MGRRKQYANDAERQATYRQRLNTKMMVVDRQRVEKMMNQRKLLHAALAQAKHAGDQCASHVYHAGEETTIEALIAWFRERAQSGDAPPSLLQ